MTTDTAQEEWEQQCFGCTRAEAKHGIDELAKFCNVGQDGGPANMALGSILSDVQELIDHNTARSREQARQYLNRVKLAIFNADKIRLWTRQ